MEFTNYIHLVLVLFGGIFFNLFFIPKLIKLAHLKDLVDLPGVRKVHRNPVAILGGVGIMLSVFAVLLCFGLYRDKGSVVTCGVAFFMGCMGLYDDLTDMKAGKKFALELIIGVALCHLGFGLNTLHGFLGIHQLPELLNIMLSVLAFAGICNAVNLIDGVDGLLTGLCAFYATFFVLFFVYIGQEYFSFLAAALMGVLIPAFLFNVFGTKNKLFMGDCGSLFLGVMLYCFVAKANQWILPQQLFFIHPLSLWILLLSIPVTDTLRVMTTRIVHGKSPFSPDKTHLHHFLLRLGFSHKRVTASILLLNGWILLSGGVLSLWISVSLQPVVMAIYAVALSCLIPLLYYICIDRYDMRAAHRAIAFFRRRRIRKSTRDRNFMERLIK